MMNTKNNIKINPAIPGNPNILTMDIVYIFIGIIILKETAIKL